MTRPRLAAMVVIALLFGCHDPASDASSRDQIKVVGSSTVYPFTTLVAEQYVAAHSDAKAPVIESTGTGAGLKLFCAGVGAGYPDIADASRRLRRSEYDGCKAHGASAIMEVQIGIDGIAFAQVRSGPALALTAADLYKALAAAPMGKPNSSRTWHDVDPALPSIPILVYGPPSTSGTRDAMEELILAHGCEAVNPAMVDKAETAPQTFEKACTAIRSDGPYVDSGENDNLIVAKLEANPNALGVFGYSYLEQSGGKLRGVTVNGVAPEAEAIAAGRYPGARPLYIYVKKAHLNAVKGLRAFLDTYASMWGPGGPLARRGLIVAPADVRDRAATIVKHRRALDPATLS